MDTHTTDDTLGARVLAWQTGRAPYEAIAEQIAALVYRYPLGKAGFTEDDCAEFLLRFHPRIRRLMARYRPTGRTFESYLGVSLRWQLRSYAASRGGDSLRLAACTAPSIGEEIFERPDQPAGLSPHEDEPPYVSGAPVRIAGGRRTRPPNPSHRPSALPLDPPHVDGTRLTRGEAQRLLFLALKACEHIDSSVCPRLAEVIGCDLVWLQRAWLALRAVCEVQRRRRETAQRIRDNAWFQARCVETRLAAATDDRERAELEAARRRWQVRAESARCRLRRTPVGPTHGQIAEVLGIAKGTVDSSVFTARREIRDPRYLDRLANLFAQS